MWELPLGLRLSLLVGLILFTLWSSKRGLHFGILLFLFTTMWRMLEATLFRAGGGWPNLTLERIVWPVVLLVFLFQWRKGRIARLPPDSIEYCMGAALVAIAISLFVFQAHVTGPAGSERLQLYELLAGFAFPFTCYFMMRRVIYSTAQVESFLIGVGLITVYLGVTSLAEGWHLRWLVFPRYILDPNLGDHYGYVRGPFLNASWNALCMVMGLPVLLWLFFHKRDASRLLWLLGLASIGLSLPFVFQRAAWLGAGAAVIITIVAWRRRRSLLIATVLLIAAVGGLLIPQPLEERIKSKWANPANIIFRLKIAEVTSQIISDHLATGVGFTQYNQALRRYGLDPGYTSHNTFLSLFVELGIFGFAPYLLIFIALLAKSIKMYWQLPWCRMLIGGMFGITAAYLIMSMAVELRIVLYPNVLFFTLWAMCLEVIRRQATLRQARDIVHQKVVSFV